jgi:hypothetical protein
MCACRGGPCAECTEGETSAVAAAALTSQTTPEAGPALLPLIERMRQQVDKLNASDAHPSWVNVTASAGLLSEAIAALTKLSAVPDPSLAVPVAAPEVMQRIAGWLHSLPGLKRDAPYWTNGLFVSDCKDAADAIASSPAAVAPVAEGAPAPSEPLCGWKIDAACQAVDSDGDIVAGVWELGHRDEDGNFYAIATVDTGNYDQPEAAEPLARAIIARLAALPAAPEPVLADSDPITRFDGMPFAEARKVILDMNAQTARGMAISLLIQLNIADKYAAPVPAAGAPVAKGEGVEP